MKKLILITLIILSSAFNCTAGKITLQYATHTSSGDEFARLVTDPLFSAISRSTDGQVNVESYFNQTLLPYDKIWDGLAAGEADIGLVISSFFYERTPLSNVMDLPTLPQNADAAEHAAAMWRLYEKYPEMQAEYLAQGIRPLIFISTGPEYLFTSKPVASLEDLKGVYLLSDSQVVVKQFEFFDSADMHFGQLYEIFGLTSKEAYGFVAPMENFILWNLGGATPYATVAPLSTTYIVIAISEKRWQTLSSELKAQIMDACGEAASRRFSTAYADHFVAQASRGSGGPTFIVLSPEERERWVYLNQPLVDEWIEACAKQGLGEVARKIYADLEAGGNTP